VSARRGPAAIPATAAPHQSWAYPAADPGRDRRIDFLRGLAMLFVVVDHVGIVSLYHLLSQERIGAVSGAELFVTLSGVVVGIVYKKRAVAQGWMAAASKLVSRALQLWMVTIAVATTTYLVAMLPGVDGRAVTTWRDGTTGRSYNLYPEIEDFLRYPVPWREVERFLLLEVGPSQFNVMGLYVALMLVSAPVLWGLMRGRTAVVLALSWLLYGVFRLSEARLLPSQFEDPFPLLAWQLLFVHGMAVGYHREAIGRWARGWKGEAVVTVAALVALVCLYFTWNNPYRESGYDFRLSVIPPDLFGWAYERFFKRTPLDLGRVVNAAAVLVVGYALLSRWWRPLDWAFGWFLAPIGQASLYVFIVHVYWTAIVASIPALTRGDVLINSLGHTVVLGVIWLMVRHRVFFRFVPR